MLKTIKTTKQMRLDELIKYVWENGINNEDYYSDLGNHVSVGVQTLLWTNGIIGKNDTFTVEIEEPITEDTVFDNLIEVTKNDNALHYNRTNISDVANRASKRFYALISGKLELVWERDEE